MNTKRFGVVAFLATALSITGVGVAMAATSEGEPKPSAPTADQKNISVTPFRVVKVTIA
jgi:hypothetical protein